MVNISSVIILIFFGISHEYSNVEHIPIILYCIAYILRPRGSVKGDITPPGKF